MKSAAFMRVCLALLLVAGWAGTAQAATYNLPSAIGSGPFANCSFTSGTTYTCNGSVALGNNDTINVTSTMTLVVTGSFAEGNNPTVNTASGASFTIQADGSVSIGNSFGGTVNLQAGGDIAMGNSSSVIGAISAGGSVSTGNGANITGNVSAGGSVSLGNNTAITGNVNATGSVSMGGGSVVNGNVTGSTVSGSGSVNGCTNQTQSNTTNCSNSTINHVEFVDNGTGIACYPATITVYACTSSATCYNNSATRYTAGNFSISPAVSPSGGKFCLDQACSTPLSGSVGLSTGTAIYLADPVARTDTIGGTTPNATNSTIQCVNQGGGSACSIVNYSSGFIVGLPNHVSGAPSVSLSVKAVESDSQGLCLPLFANQSRPETISYAYVNPSTAAPGSSPVATVGGTQISTSGASVTLKFDQTGTANPAPTFTYSDVGQLNVTVSEPNLPITGTTSPSPIVVPASLAISAVSPSSGTVKAGNPVVGATVTAQNSSGAATPNFGRESPAQTVTLTPVMFQPTSSNGTQGAMQIGGGSPVLSSFSNGVASTSALSYSEVGLIDLRADVTSYLGSGLNATGNTGSTGSVVPRFTPDHFVLRQVTTPLVNRSDLSSCTTPSSATPFTYMSEPMTVTFQLQAVNAANNTTMNYQNFSSTVSGFSPSNGNFVNFTGAATTWTATGSNGLATAMVASNYAVGSGTCTVYFTASGNTAYSCSSGVTAPTNGGSARIATAANPSMTWGPNTSLALSPGYVQFSAQLQLNRSATAPDGPFYNNTSGVDTSVHVGFAPTDGDGITTTQSGALGGSSLTGLNMTSASGVGSPDRVQVTTVNEYFGRLKLQNAFGSPSLNLPILVAGQYWNGSYFVTNTNDYCTAVPPTAVAMTDVKGTIASTCRTTLPTAANMILSQGVKYWVLPAPGANVSGNLLLTALLAPAFPVTTATGSTCLNGASSPSATTATNQAYLQGNWQNSATNPYGFNPAINATFGVYSGGSAVLYQREIY